MINTNKITFITSAADVHGFVESDLPQVVFAGKSNVGKSSVINSLSNQKNLARVGKTPGKTIHVNYFDAEGKELWVDLPGYGYAKVSFEEKKRWARLIEGYFAREQNIALGVLIVDARHEPGELDQNMLEFFRQTGTPVAIVANKCDKLKKSELDEARTRVATTLGVGEESVLLYSAEKRMGRDELFHLICTFEKNK
ncbi:MAG: YihA family ribosome biogenesis GTP-binding protein [Clostridia bacterium]|nr:YihA family ribosome biogenesis GTP-binding protein [Clostridia bacterium]